MVKFLIIICAFACISMAFCQEYAKDQLSSASNSDYSDHKDPGSNRLGSVINIMDPTPQFQIKKSIYNSGERCKRFIVQIENLGNNLQRITINEEIVADTGKIPTKSDCYLVSNSSIVPELRNELIKSGKISINDNNSVVLNPTRILNNSTVNSIVAGIPEINKESTILYSFDVCLEGNADRIPYSANTIVDVEAHPSSTLEYSGEISPNKVFTVFATPSKYCANTGETLEIMYQVEYIARITDPEKINISMMFNGNSNYEILKISDGNQDIIPTLNNSYINLSINPSQLKNVTLTCKFRNEGIFPIPMLYIKYDRLQYPEMFSDVKITVEEEYPKSFWLSFIALVISFFALAATIYISHRELSENRKTMEINTNATNDQGCKLKDINTTLREINFNLNRMRKKMQ